MRTLLIVVNVVTAVGLAEGPAYADCQGGPVFGETIFALDASALGWAAPADIEYVKGSLKGLPTYTSWIRGSLLQATGLDISHDNPPPGEGVFYFVKPSGPPCGSWQSNPGAEPARDEAIEPPCSLVAPTDDQMQAAIDAGLQAAPNPWGDEGDARRFFEVTQGALGCAFESFEPASETLTILETPPQWNPAEFYCGLDFPNSFVAFALEIPAGPCLNLACFNHDACYFANCVGGGCAFALQTVNTGCDTPLILDACGSSGCLQQDGWRRYFANKFICTMAIAFVTAQQSNLLCQDPPCNDPGEVCIASTAECCGPAAAEICDNRDNDCDGLIDEDLASTPTACGVGACAATGAIMCIGGVLTDTCEPGIPGPEACDGVDNDCDGSIDEGGDALCSDGNACTGVETCQGSAGCQAGSPLNCDDANPCTADSCDPATGCMHPPIAGCNPADGCSDGTREGFVDSVAFPNVAACAGPWSDRIDGASAQALCAQGWHVCSPADNSNDRAILGTVTYSAVVNMPGCFPYNAAQDNGACHPCVGDQPRDDMGAVGGNCTGGYYNASSFSCIGSGRIDADCCGAYTTDHACRQNGANPHTGVVCCKSASLCLEVSGAGWVEAPDSASLDVSGELTIEFWANMQGGTPCYGDQCFPAVSKWADGAAANRGYFLDARAGTDPRPRFTWSWAGADGNHANLFGPTVMPLNEWHHYAGVRSGTQMFLYIDGSLTASTTCPDLSVLNVPEPLRIGRGLLYNQDVRAIGQIDEVRIWNVARSQADIQADRHGLALPQPGLVGYWTFNEASGVALDLSGNGNDATFQGDATRVPCAYP